MRPMLAKYREANLGANLVYFVKGKAKVMDKPGTSHPLGQIHPCRESMQLYKL